MAWKPWCHESSWKSNHRQASNLVSVFSHLLILSLFPAPLCLLERLAQNCSQRNSWGWIVLWFPSLNILLCISKINRCWSLVLFSTFHLSLCPPAQSQVSQCLVDTCSDFQNWMQCVHTRNAVSTYIGWTSYPGEMWVPSVYFPVFQHFGLKKGRGKNDNLVYITNLISLLNYIETCIMPYLEFYIFIASYECYLFSKPI